MQQTPLELEDSSGKIHRVGNEEGIVLLVLVCHIMK